MLRSSSRTSTKTGVAPVCTITFAVAGQVIGVVTTSSPGPTPSATSDRWSAAVPEASASTWSASRNSCIRSSSFAAFGPVVSHPERSVAVTAAISSSPIAGGWKPNRVSRLDESFDIDLEPNDRLRLRGAFERLLSAVADGQHRACTIGPSPDLAEPVTGAAVDTDPTDALERNRLLHARHLAQLSRRRDEEAHAGTADLGDRCQRPRGDFLAEGRGQRGAVQVDTERDTAELGVVAAAQARGQLADAWPLRAEQHLYVARAVRDSDGARRARRSLDHGADLRRPELARPDVRQGDAERRQRRGQPVGHGEREEMAVHGERVHRHLAAGNELLDEQGRAARGVERDSHGLLDILGRADQRQASLPLPVGRLHDTGKADLPRGLRGFGGA